MSAVHDTVPSPGLPGNSERAVLSLSNEKQRQLVIQELGVQRIRTEDKTAFALTILGLRPANLVGSGVMINPPDVGQVIENADERFNVATGCVIRAGLHHSYLRSGGRTTFYVANDQGWLERIAKADKQRDHRALGECFGFPETAIDAWMNGELLDMQEGHRLAWQQGIGVAAFLMWRLSRDHASEELETAARWSQAVQTASPQIFAQQCRWAEIMTPSPA
jgi:hypothetical protein